MNIFVVSFAKKLNLLLIQSHFHFPLLFRWVNDGDDNDHGSFSFLSAAAVLLFYFIFADFFIWQTSKYTEKLYKAEDRAFVSWVINGEENWNVLNINYWFI